MVESGPTFKDHCNFAESPEIQEVIKSRTGEEIKFSCTVIKFNRFNMKQERDLMITNLYTYNIKNKKVKRPIKIQNLMAFSYSSAAGIKEFIIHVKNDYDYRFISDQFQEIKECLKYLFHKVTGKNLPVYKVQNAKLKEYETTKKDLRNGKDVTPEEKFLDLKENVFQEGAAQEVDHGRNSVDSTQSDSSSMDSSFMREPSRTIYAKKGDTQVSLQSFHFIKVIGRGSFGKVFLVKKKDDGHYFAMKSLRKDVIIDYDQIESTKLEQDILLKADHPFLVGMNYVFQTDQKIFFVMRFVRGGELFMHLRNVTRFEESRAKFYAAQVAIAIGYLHKQHIIYRDLKPENILMDEDGYICLTDFGLAKIINEENKMAYSFCGTPEYLAPEILNETGHAFPVDWWALGILTYEMIVGFPPFYTGANTNNKMYELIKKKDVYFPDPQKHKIHMSDESKDFIKLLLSKNPAQRLGTNGGLEEILSHPWFADLSKETLEGKGIDAPFKPKLGTNIEDVSNFDKQFTKEEVVVSMIDNKRDLDKIKKHKQQFDNF